ncbi:MAG TPA: sigma-70 family RNA polymerase sigma factor [Longimicrobiales bacterium]|nr:sigma-70 family RNA polymerase sigma factor [Longimicrobiales bacterium]
MSLESIMQRLRDAFDMLNRRDPVIGMNEPPAPRPRRDDAPTEKPDHPALEKEGFSEEALPWMDAVHRFAMRLTHSDQERAADLVQDTFLKAYRSWHQFERGTSCRSWLFTICKNTHLKILDEARTRREITDADLDADVDAMGVLEVHEHAKSLQLDGQLFDSTLDRHVVEAIDALPDDYRDVLVLSDLGDLNYAEISQVLDIPIGTVKSRLFRARRRLQEQLIDYAADVGLIQDASA